MFTYLADFQSLSNMKSTIYQPLISIQLVNHPWLCSPEAGAYLFSIAERSLVHLGSAARGSTNVKDYCSG